MLALCHLRPALHGRPPCQVVGKPLLCTECYCRLCLLVDSICFPPELMKHGHIVQD